jgi:hypothetical protein
MNKWNKTKENKTYLVCKAVKFYSSMDEDIFFEWLNRMESVESLSGAKDELYLDIVDRELNDQEIFDLIGLFSRYQIDMHQLAKLLTTKNEHVFEAWHEEIFGKPRLQ